MKAVVCTLLICALFLLEPELIAQSFDSPNAAIKRENTRISFMENKGQIRDQFNQPRADVLFSGNIAEVNFFLRRDGISYQLYKVQSWKEKESGIPKGQGLDRTPDTLSVHRIDIDWVNCNNDFTIEYGETLRSKTNFYGAHNKEGVIGAKSYKTITFKDVWDGIDIIWYERNGSLEYDFIVENPADYKRIKLNVSGVDITLNESGDLQFQTKLGGISESAPVSFQNGREVSSAWVVEDKTISLAIPKYKRNAKLIIDPVVKIWGTYYGGFNFDVTIEVDTDDSLNVYVAGTTKSPSQIATAGSHQTTINMLDDGFVVKFNSKGERIWSTYYGGPEDEYVYDLSFQEPGILYVVGDTESKHGIATSGSYQSAKGNQVDVFIVRFDRNGIRKWGTYFGGNRSDYVRSCDTDTDGNIYFTGHTTSSTGITTIGSFQPAYGGIPFSDQDGYLAKMDSAGNLIWSTYYGVYGYEYFNSVHVDGAGDVYIGGKAQSSTALTSPGCHQSLYGGLNYDGFLAKFTAGGNRLWATYYGGNNLEEIWDISSDANLNAYIVGNTGSSNNIATPGSHQSSYVSSCGFIAKFSAGGVRKWGTYYRASNSEGFFSCNLDKDSNIYAAGTSWSTSGVGTSNTFQPNFGGGLHDGFIVKFDAGGANQWGTYLGGSDEEEILNGHLDKDDNYYVVGHVTSSNGISTPGAHQDTNNLSRDGFLVKIADCEIDSASITVAACDSFVSPGESVWYSTGIYKDTLTASTGCDSILTVDLTIHLSTQHSFSETACKSYVAPSGKIFTKSGSYSDTIPSANLCDSVLFINLTVTKVNALVLKPGDWLIASPLKSHYQWMDCATGKIIEGATDSIYRPSVNGSYAVIVEINSCVDTSECINFVFSTIDENSQKSEISIFPNPNTGQFAVASPEKCEFDITDMAGKVVYSGQVKKGINQLSTSLSKGFYMMRIYASNEPRHIKIEVR